MDTATRDLLDRTLRDLDLLVKLLSTDELLDIEDRDHLAIWLTEQRTRLGRGDDLERVLTMMGLIISPTTSLDPEQRSELAWLFRDLVRTLKTCLQGQALPTPNHSGGVTLAPQQGETP